MRILVPDGKGGRVELPLVKGDRGPAGEQGADGQAGPPGATGVTVELLDRAVNLPADGTVLIETPRVFGMVQFVPSGEWSSQGCLVMPRVFTADGERYRDSVGAWGRTSHNGGGVYRYLPDATRELALDPSMYVEGVELVPWGSHTATVTSLTVSGAVKLPTWAALTRDVSDVSAQRIVVRDTRNANESPAWYMSTHPKTVVSEFKLSTVVGLDRNDGYYAMVYTVVQWGDRSGGYPSQTAYQGSRVWRRYGVSDSAWSEWQELADKAYVDTAVRVLEAKIPAGRPVEVMPATPSWSTARDWLRAKLLEYGTTYDKVVALPFDIDSSQVTSMNSMFYGCSSLTQVPAMNTSQVTNMNNMFRGCSSLTQVPAMNTSQVTNMNSMFYGCSSLTQVPAMNTSQVTSMNSMFYGCSSLTQVPAMNTSQVTNMSYMFRDCSSLYNAGVGGLIRADGTKPGSRSYMLYGSGLTREPFITPDGAPIN